MINFTFVDWRETAVLCMLTNTYLEYDKNHLQFSRNTDLYCDYCHNNFYINLANVPRKHFYKYMIPSTNNVDVGIAAQI
jgi:hypothetical protein